MSFALLLTFTETKLKLALVNADDGIQVNKEISKCNLDSNQMTSTVGCRTEGHGIYKMNFQTIK